MQDTETSSIKSFVLWSQKLSMLLVFGGFFGQVFMKEWERQLLQDLLHQEVLRRITLLQRWFRCVLCRRQFLSLRQAAVIIQVGDGA